MNGKGISENTSQIIQKIADNGDMQNQSFLFYEECLE